MKKLLILLIGLAPLFSNAQDFDLPKKIENVFNKMFEDAEDIFWSEVDNGYEASFYVDEDYKLAVFSIDGIWIETAINLNIEIASTEIAKAIYKKFNTHTIDNIFQVETANKKQFYRLQIDDGDAVYIVKMSYEFEILESQKVSDSSISDDFELEEEEE